MTADLRLAFRQLAKSPGFTAVAILTLALGIGLNTSMFSLMNLLLLQPLPYADKDQLVRLYRTTPQSQTANHSIPDYVGLAEGSKEFADLAGFRNWSFNLAQPGRPAVNLSGVRASAEFFPILGMKPELGRFFHPEEDLPGNHVAILSHATWHAQFGGDPAVVGRNVRIDGESTTIVGVMPASFSNVFLWGPGDIFRPLAPSDAEKTNHDDTSLNLLGRYRSAASLDQLNTRLTTLAARLAPRRSEARSKDGLRAVTLQSLVQNRNIVMTTMLLLGLAGFVLLIACANLANLQFARAVARIREFGIRAALGASRRHLLGPLLAESLLLALAGGAAGILVALWSNDWLSSQMSSNGFVVFKIGLDGKVLGFALGLSLLTGLVFGLVPAWVMSRVNVSQTLKSGGRGSTGDRAQNRFRNSLIVAQFSLSLVLLAGAAFFIHGLDRMLQREVGWNTTQTLMAVMNVPPAKYATPDQTYAFYTRLQERLGALPGAEQVGVAWTLPMFQYLTNRSYVVEGRDAPPVGHEPLASVNGITPSYLDTLQVKLISGRNFSSTDTLTSLPVALINEAMAKTLFPGESPLGRRIGNPDPASRGWLEIVGVVADHGFAVSFLPPATRSLVLRPLAQETWNYVTVTLRARSPGSLAEPMRKVIAELDSDLPLQQFGTVRQVIAQFTSTSAMMSTLLIVFAMLGLFLAALGLYGVIARTVVQRTPEIGVRVALGAQSGDVVWLVLGSGIRLALIGSVIGLFGAYGIARLLAALSPTISEGVSATTTITLIFLVTLILLATAGLACWLPARRATKVDPMVALRAE